MNIAELSAVVVFDVSTLCDESEALLCALNHLQKKVDAEDEDTEEAERAVTEAFQAVTEAIYYARKRVLGMRKATRTSWEDA